MKISFIISLYNKERFIDRCINSFLNLTLDKAEFEVIFVDDCSTDKSVSIVKNYQKKYDFIFLYQTTQNTGSPATPRNIGIDKAQGILISIIDADDWIDGKGVSDLVNQMIENNSDVGFGKSFKHNSKRTYQISRFASFETKNNLIPYRIKNIFRALGPPGKIFSKSLVKSHEIRFKDFKYGEDKLFFSEVIACAKSASMTDKTVYHVDRYPQNNSLVQQTNILTRAPLNIEIAEEICKLQINNIAKIFILERIVEADFLNGLIIRKEFLEFENQNELIWYIDKLDVILNNYGFEMKNLIHSPALKNVFELYRNGNIQNLNLYIKHLLWDKSKIISDNKIELLNTSTVKVPYTIYENFYPVYNGSLYENGTLYIAIKMLQDPNVVINKVYLMEKANEENLIEVPYIIKNGLLLIEHQYLEMEVNMFNILIFANDSEARLVYSSFPYAGKNIMNRQEFKLEIKNPEFEEKSVFKVQDYINKDVSSIRTIKEVPIYKDFNFSKDNVIGYKKANTILSCERVVSLPDGGSAFKIKDDGFVLGLKCYITESNLSTSSNEYYFKIPDSSMLISNKTIAPSNKNLGNISKIIYEGELIYIHDIKIIGDTPYFIIENSENVLAKRSLFTQLKNRNYENYILENVSKIKVTKTCYLYSDRNFKEKPIKKLKPQMELIIDRIVYNNNSVPRFMTSEGNYLTTNKEFVSVIN